MNEAAAGGNGPHVTTRGGVPTAKVDPHYLKSNAGVHAEFVFGALAELTDNAIDTDARARTVLIDFVPLGQGVHATDALKIEDDGCGMNATSLRNMLSFGVSKKEAVDGIKPIGRWGNGFKSASMRLAKDALVFTRTTEGGTQTAHVGMLSQTYLDAEQLDTITTPIISIRYDGPDHSPRILDEPDLLRPTNPNLKKILKYSPLKTPTEILNVLLSVDRRTKLNATKHSVGTVIYLYNQLCCKLVTGDEIGKFFGKKRMQNTDGTYVMEDGLPELAVHKEKHDIYNTRAAPDDFEHFRSLRKYLSVLYVQPKTGFYLLGSKVRACSLWGLMKNSRRIAYTPMFRVKDEYSGRPEPITIYVGEIKDVRGLCIYHNKRLIKAFEPLKGRALQHNVVCVCEADFLRPSNDKQRFTQDDAAYANLISKCKGAVNDYLDEVMIAPVEGEEEREDVVQCDECGKWKPMGTLHLSVAERAAERKRLEAARWVCADHPDPQYNSCDKPGLDDDFFKKNTPKLQRPRRSASTANAIVMPHSASDSSIARGGTNVRVERMPVTESPRRVSSRSSSQSNEVDRMNETAQRAMGSRAGSRAFTPAQEQNRLPVVSEEQSEPSSSTAPPPMKRTASTELQMQQAKRSKTQHVPDTSAASSAGTSQAAPAPSSAAPVVIPEIKRSESAMEQDVPPTEPDMFTAAPVPPQVFASMQASGTTNAAAERHSPPQPQPPAPVSIQHIQATPVNTDVPTTSSAAPLRHDSTMDTFRLKKEMTAFTREERKKSIEMSKIMHQLSLSLSVCRDGVPDAVAECVDQLHADRAAAQTPPFVKCARCAKHCLPSSAERSVWLCSDVGAVCAALQPVKCTKCSKTRYLTHVPNNVHEWHCALTPFARMNQCDQTEEVLPRSASCAAAAVDDDKPGMSSGTAVQLSDDNDELSVEEMDAATRLEQMQRAVTRLNEYIAQLNATRIKTESPSSDAAEQQAEITRLTDLNDSLHIAIDQLKDQNNQITELYKTQRDERRRINNKVRRFLERVCPVHLLEQPPNEGLEQLLDRLLAAPPLPPKQEPEPEGVAEETSSDDDVQQQVIGGTNSQPIELD